MKIIIKIALLVFLCSDVHAAAIKNDDNLIVPGNRVGLVTKDITEKELRAALLKNELKGTIYNHGEGFLQCATEIYPDSKKSATLVWQNASYDISSDGVILEDYEAWRNEVHTKNYDKCNTTPTNNKPALVGIDKPYWKTKQNVRVGMSLTDLEKALGQELKIFCCETDLDGWVEHKIKNLSIIMTLPSTVRPKLEKAIKGGTIRSKKLSRNIKDKIKITYLIVKLNEESVNTPKVEEKK